MTNSKNDSELRRILNGGTPFKSPRQFREPINESLTDSQFEIVKEKINHKKAIDLINEDKRIEINTNSGSEPLPHNSKYLSELLDIKQAEVESLKAEISELKKQFVEQNNDLHPRERNTLLKIIAVMAKDGYNNDLSEPYGEISKIISTEAQLLDLSITAETVGDKLKSAKQFLDSN